MVKIKDRLSASKMLLVFTTVLVVLAVVAVSLLIGDLKYNAGLKKAAVVPAAVVANGNCKLSVPTDIFNHLETPWQLLAPCHEADPNNNVFVQAVILNKDTGQLSTYSPLVIDAVTAPAIVPVAPVLPANRVIGIFVGGNDVNTTLVGASTQCVNGAVGKVFGQMAFCGARGLFDAINNFRVNLSAVKDRYGNVLLAASSAPIAIPPIGTETDGQPCPTVRDFRIVDQDQSDNVQTTYLSVPGGQTAQNTAANRAVLAGAGVIKNGSDNRLLSLLIDPAVGCHPWLIPDLADNGNLVPTLVTDELQAAAYQRQPVALIPAGDPMVGPNSLPMVNAYRLNVDQPRAATLADASVVPYCENMTENAPPWINYYQAQFTASVSPVAGMNLFDFLNARFIAAQQILKCP